MRNRALPIFVLMLLAWFRLSAQNPYIRQFTTQDGLPSNSVFYIFQDSKKFIWFATNAGVVKYDGTTFTNYRKKDGLGSNIVIYIKEDSFGRIWFFHFDGSLSFISGTTIFSKSNTPYLNSVESSEFFFDFFQDSDSTLYFYNRFSEIISLDRYNTLKKFSLREKLVRAFQKTRGVSVLAYYYLRRIARAYSGAYLIWTGEGVYTLKTLSDEPLFMPLGFNVFRAHPVDEHTCFINTYKEKLMKFRDETLVDSVTILSPGKSSLTSVLADAAGNIWVADFHNGLSCSRGNTLLQHFNIQKPQSILQDNENNIWVGSMNEGVYRINWNLLGHCNYPADLFGHSGITGLSREWKGGVWLTSWNHVWLLKNRVFNDLQIGTEDEFINFIFQAQNGALILGEKGRGFNILSGISLDSKTKQVRFRERRKLSIPLTNISENSTGEKLSGTVGGTVYCTSVEKLFSGAIGFDAGHRNFSIFYDMNDNLVLNNRVMYYYRDNRLELCTKFSRFDNLFITSHIVTGKSGELFNIEGDTIYLFDGIGFHNLTAAFDNPIAQQVIKIVYHAPAIYLATASNVYKCEKLPDLSRTKKVHLSMLDINFRNIHDMLVSNDSLVIATDDGLTVIPEALIPGMTTHVPIPYMCSVSFNDREMDPEVRGVQARGSTKIAFDFGCINYSSTPVVYAYKLEGLDTSWTYGATGNVIYQRLLNGAYTFKLKVRKSTSAWSDIIEYPFVIKASVWRHPLFYAFLGILFIGVISAFIIRRKNIQMRQRELDHHLVTLELKSLQSMMNPHFIFNAMGSIQNFLLQNKTGEAGLYLSQFARLIRQNMNALNTAMIGLEDEIDRLKNYLDLERLRMEDRFDYVVEIGEDFEPEDMQIPSMIIQPFVENSIWHGVSSLEEKGIIRIRFERQDEKAVLVIIEDNGIGIRRGMEFKPKGEKHVRLGMEMTRKRLELLGRKYSVHTRVTITDAHPGQTNPGTLVQVVMPYTICD